MKDSGTHRATTFSSIPNKESGQSVQSVACMSVRVHPSLSEKRKDTFSRSLFVVGEIGGNDYNYGFLQSWSFQEVKSLVPHVINTISTAIHDLIDMGAKTLLVPGNFPIGCIAAFLTYYENSKVEDYNMSTGCINWLNEFSEYHNNILKQELNRLRYIHPHTTIIYADYFNAVTNILSPANSTRLERVPLAACCGSGGGRYNYGKSISCGSENSTVCGDSSTYLSWDGMHFTEATYKAIAKGILEGPFADPSINKTCSSSNIGYVDLIDMGAKTLLVPGNFPIGCIAAFLTYYENSKVEDYNTSTGCINWLNEFSEYHNNILKQELNRLRYIHPHTTIIYADYFNAVMNILSPANSTRLEKVPLAACCGSGGGRYNYGKSISCGSENSTVCGDPSTYLSWDGLHFTEATYKAIAKGILEGPFADPSINKTCSSSNIGYVVKELTINVSKAD
ncbi:GDSL esterase/lipase [Dendrobium catenatum]|uniref:GDSL esterase/lipase n=1 Tax=Dendrobium catenatum TaxID=906689 RepID=A0A2I0X2G6_9ASPA|nr:GDSL esterase/lipase [Dendrobium catenatum]